MGPSFPELDTLTEIEHMLVARVRPLVQIRTVRTGLAAYIGRIANLEKKVEYFFRMLRHSSGKGANSSNQEADAGGMVEEGAPRAPCREQV